ncbi:thump domain-containing protein [Scheffersomyces xylosifermentans]|uniref:thump domain-containing protein n=1 Tax=Scheffersomyces xylosifermentans TaxID=1304137 RepID=UPI00315DF34B
MGKRKSGDKGSGGKNKKYRASGFIDPNTQGVYATCNRHKEQQCRKELINLFSDKIAEYFDLEGDNADSEDENENGDNKPNDLSIEEQIKRELSEMNEAKDSKKELLKPIELDCECLVFIKTRRPVDPVELVRRICEESYNLNIKTTRYTQKLTPITYSVTPTMEEVKKMAKKVLAPHFHKEENQEPIKFAIQISRRNFNALAKDDLIKAIAESVGRDHGHSVDLKNYEKLIVVEGYKTNIGMSVVDNYLKYDRFNLQQIFEKNLTNDGEHKNSAPSRVAKSKTETIPQKDAEEEQTEKEETEKETASGN